MTAVVPFRKACELSAEQHVTEFVALSRYQLDNLIPSASWTANIWDVSAEFTRKGKPNAKSKLHFFQHATLHGRGDHATGCPFDPAFADFARAYIRYENSAKTLSFERHLFRLLALAHIEAAFRELQIEPNICRLSPNVLTKAVTIGIEGVTDHVKYERALLIRNIYQFCLQRNMLFVNFQWRHGIPKPEEPGERIGRKFNDRRAEKLPSGRAFEALAHIYCNPRNLKDQLLSAVCLISICTPWRASEILQLRTDCEVHETRREGDRDVITYGLRAYPLKNNPPQIKWSMDIAVDQLKESIERLLTSCADARVIAAWYVENPTTLYLPPDLANLRNSECITSNQLAEMLGQTNGTQCAKKLRLEPCKVVQTRYMYRFADVERAILSELPMDFPHQNGFKTHLYSDTLILVRKGAFLGPNGSRVMFEPIDIFKYNLWLSGNADRKSVFENYGFVEEDGSPIRITTHAFRHWNNNLGHRRGLSQVDLALWSGRDPGQNKYYDHQSPAEFQYDLQQIALKAGGIGPLFEAAENLPNPAIISREDFLREQVGSSHVTEVGACIHDYALQPCQNHGDCVTCEENVFVKGDHKHRDTILRLLDLAEQQLGAAKTSMSEEYYGADIWVKEHERKVKRLRIMLNIHDDPNVSDGKLVTLPPDRSDNEIDQAMRRRSERE